MIAHRTDDLGLLIAAARSAGAIAMQYFRTDMVVQDKGNNHPVTQADLEVDRHLHHVLMGARPDYGWLSEETVDDQSRLNTKRVFLVDPIDGTRAFIRGLPHFVVSLAVVEDGVPQAGVVYNPAKDVLFAAARGLGATRNGKSVQVRSCNSLEQCRMIAHQDLFRWSQWAGRWPQMQVDARNSMAWRMVLVAGGRADATLTLRPKSDWDLAAADLIAREAGAKVTDPLGREFAYNLPGTRKSGVICAGSDLYALIRQRIEETGRFPRPS